MNNDYVLRMVGITKSFPGVKALDNVDLELKKGEVLAILGENGAGKSTLLKILSGVYSADSGYIEMEGVKQNFRTPGEASCAGVSIIYQELNYLSELTVGENIFLGRLPQKPVTKFVDWEKVYAESKNVLDLMQVGIDPRAPMSKLSVAEKQLVEIAKALSRNMKILVMDEPTSALSESEADKLLNLVKSISKTGKSIIYISHRIDELFTVSDRVLVMRDGCKVGIELTTQTDKETLIRLMVGRDIKEMYPKKDIKKGEMVFEAKNLSNAKLKNVSLNVHAGEILGIFGLMGSGRTNLARVIFGADKKESGEIYINGKRVIVNSPNQALKNGIAYLPSERKSEGLILCQSVKGNMTLAVLDKFKRIVFTNSKKVKEIANRWVNQLAIKTPSIDTIVESLSGGNQQKVVLSKWLETDPKIIILNEPTRGIDVGAKIEIYNLIEMLCEKGLGVIMISSELPEILALSDRIMIISNGRITGELDNDYATQEEIMRLAI